MNEDLVWRKLSPGEDPGEMCLYRVKYGRYMGYYVAMFFDHEMAEQIVEYIPLRLLSKLPTQKTV